MEKKADRGWKESGERRGGNGVRRRRHTALWSFKWTEWSQTSLFFPLNFFPLQGCDRKFCHTGEVALTPRGSPAHATPKPTNTHFSTGPDCDPEGCSLIYRSPMRVCVCGAYLLLCHPAGSQLWAQHSGAMDLPRWQRAEYLLQTFGPSITARKAVMFTRRNSLEYKRIQVRSCNLTVHGEAGIIDCAALDSVLRSACLLSLRGTEGDRGEFSFLRGFIVFRLGTGSGQVW